MTCRNRLLLLVAFLSFFLIGSCGIAWKQLVVTVEPPESAGYRLTPKPGIFGYPVGEDVEVDIVPQDGYYLAEWKGDYPEGENQAPSLTLTMNSRKELTATMEESTPGWLIMLYLDGANNLEGSAITDFDAIEYGLSRLSPEDRGGITVVALFDRISGYNTSNEDWRKTRLYQIKADSERGVIRSPVLEGWWGSETTELSMGDRQTLSDFIGWARKTYPRHEKQALILWNHGGGARGGKVLSEGPSFPFAPRDICSDEEIPADDLDYILYLDEIQQALQEHYSGGKAGDKLDLIGMDACLMATVEVAYEFRDLAKYFVSSPGLEWGGWYYSELVEGLSLDTSPAEFATRVVKTYRDKAGKFGLTENTQTAVDLSEVKTLKEELDELAEALEPRKTSVENFRDDILHYWSDSDGDGTAEPESIMWPYYEIGDMCNKIRSNTPIDTRADAVEDALRDAIVYAWAGTDMGDYEGDDVARGLSIFFSRGNETYDDAPHYAYQWWYTAKETEQWWPGGHYYGNIDFADSDRDGSVETWRELFEAWYDDGTGYTPGAY